MLPIGPLMLRDGRPEPYHLNKDSLFIGDEKVELAHGEHTYTIKYKTDRHIGFYSSKDELEWRIEGYNSGHYNRSFPIERSSLTLELPAGTVPKNTFIEGYANPDYPKKDFTTSVAGTKAGSENILSFTSTPIGRKEYGPYIRMELPKGFIHEPTMGKELQYFLALIVVIPLLFLFAFPVVFILGTFMGIIHIRLTSLIVAMTALHVIFYHLIKVPTPTGREMLDKIEGFKMFLSATEKDRMNMMNPPEKTPELLRKYMPYALVLNVGQKWSEQFSGIMSAEALLAAQNTDPYFLYSLRNVFAEIKFDLRSFLR